MPDLPTAVKFYVCYSRALTAIYQMHIIKIMFDLYCLQDWARTDPCGCDRQRMFKDLHTGNALDLSCALPVIFYKWGFWSFTQALKLTGGSWEVFCVLQHVSKGKKGKRCFVDLSKLCIYAWLLGISFDVPAGAVQSHVPTLLPFSCFMYCRVTGHGGFT